MRNALVTHLDNVAGASFPLYGVITLELHASPAARDDVLGPRQIRVLAADDTFAARRAARCDAMTRATEVRSSGTNGAKRSTAPTALSVSDRSSVPIAGPTLKHQISKRALRRRVSSAVNDADVDDDEEVVLASRSPSSFRARSRSSSFLLICVKPTFASMTKTAR